MDMDPMDSTRPSRQRLLTRPSNHPDFEPRRHRQHDSLSPPPLNMMSDVPLRPGLMIREDEPRDARISSDHRMLPDDRMPPYDRMLPYDRTLPGRPRSPYQDFDRYEHQLARSEMRLDQCDDMLTGVRRPGPEGGDDSRWHRREDDISDDFSRNRGLLVDYMRGPSIDSARVLVGSGNYQSSVDEEYSDEDRYRGRQDRQYRNRAGSHNRSKDNKRDRSWDSEKNMSRDNKRIRNIGGARYQGVKREEDESRRENDDRNRTKTQTTSTEDSSRRRSRSQERRNSSKPHRRSRSPERQTRVKDLSRRRSRSAERKTSIKNSSRRRSRSPERQTRVKDSSRRRSRSAERKFSFKKSSRIRSRSRSLSPADGSHFHEDDMFREGHNYRYSVDEQNTAVTDEQSYTVSNWSSVHKNDDVFSREQLTRREEHIPSDTGNLNGSDPVHIMASRNYEDSIQQYSDRTFSVDQLQMLPNWRSVGGSIVDTASANTWVSADTMSVDGSAVYTTQHNMAFIDQELDPAKMLKQHYQQNIAITNENMKSNTGEWSGSGPVNIMADRNYKDSVQHYSDRTRSVDQLQMLPNWRSVGGSGVGTTSPNTWVSADTLSDPRLQSMDKIKQFPREQLTRRKEHIPSDTGNLNGSDPVHVMSDRNYEDSIQHYSDRTRSVDQLQMSQMLTNWRPVDGSAMDTTPHNMALTDQELDPAKMLKEHYQQNIAITQENMQPNTEKWSGSGPVNTMADRNYEDYNMFLANINAQQVPGTNLTAAQPPLSQQQVIFKTDMMCPACPDDITRYTTRDHFGHHWKKTHSKYMDVFRCPAHLCFESFSQRSVLTGHVKSAHNNGQRLDVNLANYLAKFQGEKVQCKPKKNPGNCFFHFSTTESEKDKAKIPHIPEGTIIIPSQSETVTEHFTQGAVNVQKNRSHMLRGKGNSATFTETTNQQPASNPDWGAKAKILKPERIHGDCSVTGQESFGYGSTLEHQQESQQPGRQLETNMVIEVDPGTEITRHQSVPFLFERDMRCPVCKSSTQFVNPQMFSSHWKKVHTEFHDMYQCPFAGCFSTAVQKKRLIKHYNKFHPQGSKKGLSEVQLRKLKNLCFVNPGKYAFLVQDETDIIQDGKIKFKEGMMCPICPTGKKYGDEYFFQKHWVEVHLPLLTKFTCPFSGCSSYELSNTNLKKHFLNAHSVTKKVDETVMDMLDKVKGVKCANNKYVDPGNLTLDSTINAKYAFFGQDETEIIQGQESLDYGSTLGHQQASQQPGSQQETDMIMEVDPDTEITRHQTVPVVFEQGMRCPACKSSPQILYVNTLTCHWKEIHTEFHDRYQCPFDGCLSIYAKRNKMVKHYTNTHQGSKEVLSEVQVTKIKNPFFVNPGKYAFLLQDETEIIQDGKIKFKEGMMCPVCKTARKYGDEYLFQKHWVEFHLPFTTKFTCPFAGCPCILSSNTYLKKHFLKAHSFAQKVDETVTDMLDKVKGFKRANYKYIDPENVTLDLTINFEQMEEERKKTITIEFKSMMQCPVCPNSRNFQKVYDFRNHWLLTHTKYHERYVCPYCDCKYGGGSKYRIQLHYKKIHNDDKELDSQTLQILDELQPERVIHRGYVNPIQYTFDIDNEEIRRQTYDHVNRIVSGETDKIPTDQLDIPNAEETDKRPTDQLDVPNAEEIDKRPTDQLDVPNAEGSGEMNQEGPISVVFQPGMKCPVCTKPRNFQKVYDFKNHWHLFHMEFHERYPCPYPCCKSGAGSKHRLLVHYIKKHNNDQDLDSTTKQMFDELPSERYSHERYINPGRYTFDCDGEEISKQTFDHEKKVTHDVEKDAMEWKGEMDQHGCIPVVFKPEMNCPVCPKSRNFQKVYDFRNHWLLCHTEYQEMYACPYLDCKTGPGSIFKLKCHYKKCHNDDKELDSQTLQILDEVKCERVSRKNYINPGIFTFDYDNKENKTQSFDHVRRVTHDQNKQEVNRQMPGTSFSIEKETDQLQDRNQEGTVPIVFQSGMKCPVCPKSRIFEKVYDFRNHWLLCHTEYQERYACPYLDCKTGPGSIFKLKFHYKKCHNDDKELDSQTLQIFDEVKCERVSRKNYINPGKFTFDYDNKEFKTQTFDHVKRVTQDQNKQEVNRQMTGTGESGTE